MPGKSNKQINAPVDYYEHPIFNPLTLRIPTRSINRMHKLLQGWLWQGDTGGFIYGDSREGKSVSIDTTQDSFITRGGIPVDTFTFTIPKRGSHSIYNVFKCIARRLKLDTHADTDEICDQILMFFHEKAKLSKSNSIILFVDEAQRMKPEQLYVFAELHDLMAENGILLCCFFIANISESQTLLRKISHDDNYSHIKNRFFNQVDKFTGICNLAEVKYALKQYDTLRFPQKGGPTYTEYFLPEAWKSGFRYQSMSTLIWDTFSDNPKKTLKLNSWGSKYFFKTVNILLTDILYNNGIDDINQNMVLAAIDESGIYPSLLDAIS